MLTTLSGEELTALRDDLEQIKESFSLMEFDEEEVDDPEGKQIDSRTTDITLLWKFCSVEGM